MPRVDAVRPPRDWRDLIAFTLPDNLASRRVMEKAGFAYEREILHAGLPHVLYRAPAKLRLEASAAGRDLRAAPRIRA